MDLLTGEVVIFVSSIVFAGGIMLQRLNTIEKDVRFCKREVMRLSQCVAVLLATQGVHVPEPATDD